MEQGDDMEESQSLGSLSRIDMFRKGPVDMLIVATNNHKTGSFTAIADFSGTENHHFLRGLVTSDTINPGCR